MSKKIVVSSIVLKLEDGQMTISLEEARALQAELNELFGYRPFSLGDFTTPKINIDGPLTGPGPAYPFDRVKY